MSKPIAIFLYSASDLIAKPWADAGVECHLFDLEKRTDKQNIIYHSGDLRRKRKELGRLVRDNDCKIIGSFTPCTDLAVSGARHFSEKAKKDALFWAKAMELVFIGLDLAEFFDIPYFIENPKSMISSILGRSPELRFDPWMYGAYLPIGHTHNLFPEVYPSRDAYNKETWIWCGNGFKIPQFSPVDPVEKAFPGFSKMGGGWKQNQGSSVSNSGRFFDCGLQIKLS